jgi:hypothetical protein
MSDFETYNGLLVQAWQSGIRRDDAARRKRAVITQALEWQGVSADSELYLGFNPAATVSAAATIYMLNVHKQYHDTINATNPRIVFVDQTWSEPVHAVISSDDYYSFFLNEDQQRQNLSWVKSLRPRLYLTTLRDYKNQDFRDREFSFPAVIKRPDSAEIWLEYHDHDSQGTWATHIYQIQGSRMQHWGPWARRPVYFKQLAKFSRDAGFENFAVHRNLMFKSLLRKNYEHVIGIS